MDEGAAPDLLGLAPDDAARICYGRNLGFVIDNAHEFVIDKDHMAELWGAEQWGVRVAEQWPDPGSRLTLKKVVVWVEFMSGGGEARAREPRRPSPPLLTPEAEPDEGSSLLDGRSGT